MKCINTDIEGLMIIEPNVYGDQRGWFMESYNQASLVEQGININFVQDNHSYSSLKGTIRGLHYQLEPRSQTKLVRCTKGVIYDVAVDLRQGSSTYGKWFGIELSYENKKQLLIPKGFAHGFLTLTNDVEVQYKVDELYAPQFDRSLRWDDPTIGLKWPIESDPILSDKDQNAPFLKDAEMNFIYGD